MIRDVEAVEEGRSRISAPSRINDQWRIIFRWEAGDANDVRIADYH